MASGQSLAPERYFNPRMYATKTERCPVELFKTYLDGKPDSMKKPDSPFYLAYIIKPQTFVWYKASPLGTNSLGNFMKSMAEAAKLTGKFTNHSTRRTMISTLRHENANPLDISQLSGHKNLKSIDTYSEASVEQQRQMSFAISGRSGGHVKPLQVNNTASTIALQSSSTDVSHSSSTSFLSGAVFNNCTISFHCPGLQQSVDEGEVQTKKRKEDDASV